MIGWILRSLSVFLAVALVVIFQPELRRASLILAAIRSSLPPSKSEKLLKKSPILPSKSPAKGFGALIAVEREIALKPFIETGVSSMPTYSKELALTIFHPKTVLHDGGLIVHNDRMVAAACISPSPNVRTSIAISACVTGQPWG